MQTFLCHLLRDRNKNQFFYYFGLIHLLHRQDLSNEWFERKLKLVIMLLSSFGKRISPGSFYCSNSQDNFVMTLELFGYQ